MRANRPWASQGFSSEEDRCKDVRKSRTYMESIYGIPRLLLTSQPQLCAVHQSVTPSAFIHSAQHETRHYELFVLMTMFHRNSLLFQEFGRGEDRTRRPAQIHHHMELIRRDDLKGRNTMSSHYVPLDGHCHNRRKPTCARSKPSRPLRTVGQTEHQASTFKCPIEGTESPSTCLSINLTTGHDSIAQEPTGCKT